MNQQVNQLSPEEGVDAIERYGVDLTRLAHEGRIDPVIGREDEIRRIVQILSRRKKNNPVLIGEPGTGKTTVVEGLARRIVEGDVPENLKGKRIIALDLSAMVAGAMFRGQFEERFKNFVRQVIESDGEVIVFIDELHTIVGTGAAEGQLDVSNMIKPELARGRFKVIGATTAKEYQKYVEKDAALERRFQHVYIQEPGMEDTITILRGIKDRYELHHGLSIKDSALIAAAILSDRYISDRFLPDKAVDLVDEAAARIRMEMNSAPVAIDDANRKLLQLEVEREALKKEKDERSKIRLEKVNREIEILKSQLNELNRKWTKEKQRVAKAQEIKEKMDALGIQVEQAQRNGEYQTAAKIKYNDLPLLEKELGKINDELEENEFIRLEVDTEEIAGIVSGWTGIPVTKMLSSEKEKILHLEESLMRRVVGQKEALRGVADVIRMSKAGMVDQNRPIGSFLFTGNTGVGKTELAKALTEALFDDEKALVRIDMTEYTEQHSAAKLIGSPPGYVGYEEGGQLTEKIRRRPYSVILFDEIEKAHLNVLNILLQILDDGRLTDAKGRTVNFKNTVIIMTSNMPQEELKRTMLPEFINRIDDIITFNDLDMATIKKIVEQRLGEVIKTAAQEDIQLSVSPDVKEYLTTNGYDPQYGARPIKRIIMKEILAAVAKYTLEFPEEKKIHLDLIDSQIVLNPPKLKAKPKKMALA